MQQRFRKLAGLIAAPFTPLHRDGSLNPDAVEDYYQLLKFNGVSGAFICGSTGEGSSLTQEEKMQLVEAWQDCAGSDPAFQVIVLVGGNNLEECESLASFSESKGIDAISFTAPSYFKPQNIEVLADCCERVAAKAPGTPFYYYHIPALTGVNFPMYDLLNSIHGRIENFAGIKYTHEDMMDYLSCLHFKEGHFNILWGRDETYLAALACGAPGAVGSTFNYAAPLYHDLKEAFSAGNLVRARQLQQQSIDMIRLLGKYGGIGTGKAFMKAIGFDCGAFRLPVLNLDEKAYQLFQEDLQKIGFSSFCSRLPQKVRM